MQIFPIHFRRLSTFCQFFAETLMMTIVMAILRQAIMANFNYIAIMAILVGVDRAINMVNNKIIDFLPSLQTIFNA